MLQSQLHRAAAVRRIRQRVTKIWQTIRVQQLQGEEAGARSSSPHLLSWPWQRAQQRGHRGSAASRHESVRPQPRRAQSLCVRHCWWIGNARRLAERQSERLHFLGATKTSFLQGRSPQRCRLCCSRGHSERKMSCRGSLEQPVTSATAKMMLLCVHQSFGWGCGAAPEQTSAQDWNLHRATATARTPAKDPHTGL